jgi:hypothetical protein
MSATLVRTHNPGDTTTAVASKNINPPAAGFAVGNRVIACVHTRTPASGATALSTVTDSKGNTWTVDITQGSASNSANAIASSTLTTSLVSTDTITFNWNANVNGTVWLLLEVSGLLSGAKDVSNTSANTGAAAENGASVLTTNVDDFIVQNFGDSTNVTVSSIAAGWTQAGVRNQIAGPTGIVVIYQEQIVVGTYNGSVTCSGAVNQARQSTVAYKVARLPLSLSVNQAVNRAGTF